MPGTRKRNPQTGQEIEWDGYQWVDITPQRETGFAVDPLNGPDGVANRQVYGQEAKQLGADRLAFSNARSEAGQLNRFSTLNQEQDTGQLYAIPGFGDWLQSLDPQASEMAGIASQLQGRARPVGSGATSDFEQRLYRSGVPSPEKQGPVNRNIIERRRGVTREEGDRLAFREEFFRHNGTLSGADEAWSKYVVAQPYTREGANASQNNIRVPWRTYFGVAAQPAGTPRAGSTRANPIKGLTDVEIQALPEGTWAQSSKGLLQVGARHRARPGPPQARPAASSGWSVQAH